MLTLTPTMYCKYRFDLRTILEYKILCTEKSQAYYYDLVVTELQNRTYDVPANDSFTVNNRKIAIADLRLHHADAYLALLEQAEEKLKAKVNVFSISDGANKLEARRVINDNRAGEFLVSGIAVDIIKYEPRNNIYIRTR